MAKDTARGPHLPSLSVSGFRGIKRLRIPRLGQVTLLGGKNSSGKTTVLEAVREYAGRGRNLNTLLVGRDEYSTSFDEDGDKMTVPDSSALFHGRTVSPESGILGHTSCVRQRRAHYSVVCPPNSIWSAKDDPFLVSLPVRKASQWRCRLAPRTKRRMARSRCCDESSAGRHVGRYSADRCRRSCDKCACDGRRRLRRPCRHVWINQGHQEKASRVGETPGSSDASSPQELG